MDEYEPMKVLGEGSYGKVYLMKSKTTRDLVCTKVIKLKNIPKKEQEACRNEVELLRRMVHPNIVGYMDSFLYKNCLCIIMEYCDAGDLGERVAKAKGVLFPETKIMTWFVQIAMGLHFMHSNRVLHRDIKTQNIFILSSGRVVLGDLGISKVMGGTADFASTQIGTPYYMSPEIFQNKPYNHKSDVWALGIVLYELATLQHAFDAQSITSLSSKIIKGRYPPIDPMYSKNLKGLIKDLLAPTPKARPDIEQILRKAFLRKRVEQFVHDLQDNGGCKTRTPLQVKALESLSGQLTAIGMAELLGDYTSSEASDSSSSLAEQGRNGEGEDTDNDSDTDPTYRSSQSNSSAGSAAAAAAAAAAGAKEDGDVSLATAESGSGSGNSSAVRDDKGSHRAKLQHQKHQLEQEEEKLYAAQMALKKLRQKAEERRRRASVAPASPSAAAVNAAAATTVVHTPVSGVSAAAAVNAGGAAGAVLAPVDSRSSCSDGAGSEGPGSPSAGRPRRPSILQRLGLQRSPSEVKPASVSPVPTPRSAAALATEQQQQQQQQERPAALEPPRGRGSAVGGPGGPGPTTSVSAPPTARGGSELSGLGSPGGGRRPSIGNGGAIAPAGQDYVKNPVVAKRRGSASSRTPLMPSAAAVSPEEKEEHSPTANRNSAASNGSLPSLKDSGGLRSGGPSPRESVSPPPREQRRSMRGGGDEHSAVESLRSASSHGVGSSSSSSSAHGGRPPRDGGSISASSHAGSSGGSSSSSSSGGGQHSPGPRHVDLPKLALPAAGGAAARSDAPPVHSSRGSSVGAPASSSTGSSGPGSSANSARESARRQTRSASPTPSSIGAGLMVHIGPDPATSALLNGDSRHGGVGGGGSNLGSPVTSPGGGRHRPSVVRRLSAVAIPNKLPALGDAPGSASAAVAEGLFCSEDDEKDFMEYLQRQARVHEKDDDEDYEVVHSRERALEAQLAAAEERCRALAATLERTRGSRRASNGGASPAALEVAVAAGVRGSSSAPPLPPASSGYDVDDEAASDYEDEPSPYAHSSLPHTEDAPAPAGRMQDRVNYLRQRCIDGMGADVFAQAFAALKKMMDEDDGFLELDGKVYDGADDGQVETVLRGIMGRDKMHLWKLMDQLLLLGA